MPRRETSELPTDPWQELLHQGDLLEESNAATPAIVDALETTEDWLLPGLADAALAIAADDDDRREVARRLVSRSAGLWKRAHLHSMLADHGLPDRRDALRAWLDR